MVRFVFLGVAVCSLASGAAVAADPPKSKSVAPLQLVVATLKDDRLVYEVTQKVTVTEYTAVTREVNGKPVTEMVPVQKEVTAKAMHALPMSELTATDTTGKEVPLADLKAALKANVPVVLLAEPLDAEWRVLFKTGTVFLEPTKK